MKRLTAVAGLSLVLLFLLAIATSAPDPVAADPGTLSLTATVLDGGSPLVPGELYTLTLQLNHLGGTSPASVRINDDLPGGLRLSGPVEVQANTALPRRVVVREGDIRWQGVISPNGAIRWRALAAAGYCPTDAPCQITRTITVRDGLGGVFTDTVAVDVATGPMLPSNVSVETEFTPLTGVQLDGAETFVVRASNANTVPVRVRLQLLAPQGAGLLLGEAQTAAMARTGALQAQSLVPQATASTFRREAEISLMVGAGETTVVPGALRLSDDFEDGTELALGARFCILDPGARSCTPGSPEHIREVPTLSYTVRYRDFGDAPDSTNHAAAAMTAYPTVQANFPTVFDTATGLPPGPAHLNIRPFHLGRRVSPERMADIGPDADGVNNILPAADVADLDRADDGVPVHTLSFQDCQPATIPVRVFIHPQAVAYFQNVDADKLANLNIWIDSNRDGDWDDVGACGAANAAEHIVVDAPVDVLTLGAGIHTLSFTTAPVPWPQAQAQRPAWLRVTLSERPANKTLAGNTLGDGRGYPIPFATGETEDYLYLPTGDDSYGADMELTGEWQLQGDTKRPSDPARLSATSQQTDAKITLRLRNRGTETARGVVLSLWRPITATLVEGTFYGHAFGPTSGDPAVCDRRITDLQNRGSELQLGDFAPGCGGTVVLGAKCCRCLTCTLAVQDVAGGGSYYPAETSQEPSPIAEYRQWALNDVNPDNDAVSIPVPRPIRAPQLSIGTRTPPSLQSIAGADALGEIELIISHPPGAEGVIRGGGTTLGWTGCLTCIDSSIALPVTADPIQYRAAISRGGHLGPFSRPIEVAAVNGIIEGSLHFTDESGRTFFPSGDRFGSSGGGTIPALLSDPAPLAATAPVTDHWRWRPLTATLKVADLAPATQIWFRTSAGVFPLLDRGGGWFSGPIEITTTVASRAALGAVDEAALIVRSGDADYETAYTLAETAEGRVTDATTGAPIGGVQITVLTEISAQADDETSALFGVWAGAPYGQPNPLTSASDGGFGIPVPNGAYQLLVSHPGYQPYRTPTIIVNGGLLVAEIPLTPEIVQAPNAVVTIDESGFSPAVLSVVPNAVVEFRNIGSADHGAASQTPVAGGGWASGLLAPGESFRTTLTLTGTLGYADAAAPANYGLFTTDAEHRVFLPFITR